MKIIFSLLVLCSLLTSCRGKEGVNDTIKPVPTNNAIKTITIPVDAYWGLLVTSNFFYRYANPEYKTNGPSDVLRGLSSIDTMLLLPRFLTNSSIISGDELKTKLELTLRRSGIKISTNSVYTLSVAIDGFYESTNSHTIIYDIETSLVGNVLLPQYIKPLNTNDIDIWEGLHFLSSRAQIWSTGSFGQVNDRKANEIFLRDIEKDTETFANDYLSANPK